VAAAASGDAPAAGPVADYSGRYLGPSTTAPVSSSDLRLDRICGQPSALRLGPELVAPADGEAAVRLAGHDLAAVADAAVREDQRPRAADAPIGLGPGAAPVLAR
jgi:hypothetical protein